MSELATEYSVQPTMLHQRKKALLEGAADIFERAAKRKEQARHPHCPPESFRLLEPIEMQFNLSRASLGRSKTKYFPKESHFTAKYAAKFSYKLAVLTAAEYPILRPDVQHLEFQMQIQQHSSPSIGRVGTSRHALTRQQQRCIPDIIMDLLCRFGASIPVLGNCERVYFDKRGWREAESFLGMHAKHFAKYRNTYLICAEDGSIVTIGWVR